MYQREILKYKYLDNIYQREVQIYLLGIISLKTIQSLIFGCINQCYLNEVVPFLKEKNAIKE